jgi:hypothetical protein
VGDSDLILFFACPESEHPVPVAHREIGPKFWKRKKSMPVPVLRRRVAGLVPGRSPPSLAVSWTLE